MDGIHFVTIQGIEVEGDDKILCKTLEEAIGSHYGSVFQWEWERTSVTMTGSVQRIEGCRTIQDFAFDNQVHFGVCVKRNRLHSQ